MGGGGSYTHQKLPTQPLPYKLLMQKSSKLLACLFDSNGNCHGHTNHGVVTCADQAHHLYVKLSYEEAFPINILGDEHIILMHSCTHYTRKIIKSQASYNNFESSFYQV